ncbi:MAG: hypothetical protein O3B01_27215 [Planctomycetota bacterium]|nr:hypothetical protein [Planctomycetota bacterium]MDA1142270.1 hypothetical protein [Planctomycetota bacterium]
MTSRDEIYGLIEKVDEESLEQLHKVVQHFTKAINGSGKGEFQSLARKWHSETRFLSSTHKMIIHPAYQRIIGMGYSAVPMILQELKEEPDYWFWALSAITGEDPVPSDSKGDLDAMSDAWLSWGEERGFIWR